MDLLKYFNLGESSGCNRGGIYRTYATLNFDVCVSSNFVTIVHFDSLTNLPAKYVFCMVLFNE